MVILALGVWMWINAPPKEAKADSKPQVMVAALTVVYCASGSLLSWANKVLSVGEHRLDLSVVLILQNTATFALIWFLSKIAPATVRALRVDGWPAKEPRR